MAKHSKASNEVYETPAGIINWVDDVAEKLTPQPGDPNAPFTVKSSGGGKAHTRQLRGLFDNEIKGSK